MEEEIDRIGMKKIYFILVLLSLTCFTGNGFSLLYHSLCFSLLQSSHLLLFSLFLLLFLSFFLSPPLSLSPGIVHCQEEEEEDAGTDTPPTVDPDIGASRDALKTDDETIQK